MHDHIEGLLQLWVQAASSMLSALWLQESCIRKYVVHLQTVPALHQKAGRGLGQRSTRQII